MKSTLTYIFKHKHYKEVMAFYNEATTKHNDAFEVWSRHSSCPNEDTFEVKELIASHISEIREVASWIKRYDLIKNSHKEGMLWLFADRGQKYIPIMGYNEYKFVSEQIETIEKYQNYFDTYNQLIRSNKEAVVRYINSNTQNHNYEDMQNIAIHKNEILQIASVLRAAHTCESKYKLAWECFSNSRKFSDIPLNELKTINEDQFSTKNDFLALYARESQLIKLIKGTNLLPINSFSKDTIEQHEEIISILASRSIDCIDIPEFSITLGESKEHKRTILDSELYGKKCNFSDSYTIQKFYTLRKSFDHQSVQFDSAVLKTKENDAAIRAFDKENGGQGVVYIEDYLKVMTEGCDLYNFIEKYKRQREQREEAKKLQRQYSKGFCSLYGSKDLDNCSFSDILTIVSSEQQIRSKNIEIEEQERVRKETERLKQEEERRKQELQILRSGISSWTQPSKSTVKCFSLYYYYPTKCSWEASDEEWDIRNLVWDFKANPNRPQSVFEITSRHQRAMNEVVPEFKRVLHKFFGSNISKLTLVCIHSSKRVVTERRYKDFSSLICNETGIANGYSYVHIAEEGDPTHLGGGVQAQFSVDNSFFKGRNVILFDDIITSGKSMERFKRLLESAGANVIAGLSIGKTKHERQGSNPIDSI